MPATDLHSEFCQSEFYKLEMKPITEKPSRNLASQTWVRTLQALTRILLELDRAGKMTALLMDATLVQLFTKLLQRSEELATYSLEPAMHNSKQNLIIKIAIL